MAKKKVLDEKVVGSGEPKPVEEVTAPEPKGRYGVELDHDIPYGPKMGTRFFENKADALAYQARFGGKLV